MSLRVLLASSALILSPSPAAREVNQVDDSITKGHSPVLVLGTSHLASLPADFDRTRFDPLLDKLAAWKPDLIAIEALDGAQCDFLRQHKHAYPDQAQTYCPDPTTARNELGLDQAGAEAELEAILAKPSNVRTADQRRRLLVLFLAAGDPASAMVQWLRLPLAERKAGGVLTDALVKILLSRKRLNENTDIAAALAARLGHERVYPVDDHTGDRATGPTDAAFDARLAELWQGSPGAAEAIEGLREVEARFIADGDVLAFYRTVNSAPYLKASVKFDFAAAAADQGPGRIGRRYLAYWETRNLRMVANIRASMGPYPGARVLAIVGSSHKPHYERYLGMSSEVRLVDAAAVLQ